MGKYLDGNGLSHLIVLIKDALSNFLDKTESQTANTVLAGPSSGSAAAPTFRSLTVADIPTGTTASTVALGNHTHSNYLNTSTTRSANTVYAGPSSGSAAAPTFRSLVVADLPTGTTASTVALGNHDHGSLYLKRQPSGTSELPQDSSATEGFPIVLSDTFANNGVISYMTKANFKTYLGYGTAASADSTDFAPSGNYWTADKASTSYWGLVNPTGATGSSNWVRTTEAGIIPYSSGGASSSLGTSSWAFKNIYGINIYQNGTKVSVEGHTHSQYFDNSTSRTANTVLAAPNGSAGAASFRALVAADIPRLDADKINLNGYSWITGATPTAIGFSATAYTSVSTSGWTYYKFLASGGGLYVYHAFGVVKFKNTAITTAHGGGYINSANLYIRLPVKARVIKSATFGTTMGGGLLGVTFLAAGGTGDWKSTTDSLINLPVRLFSPVSQAAANSNNDNQYIPVDIWFTAAG